MDQAGVCEAERYEENQAKPVLLGFLPHHHRLWAAVRSAWNSEASSIQRGLRRHFSTRRRNADERTRIVCLRYDSCSLLRIVSRDTVYARVFYCLHRGVLRDDW